MENNISFSRHFTKRMGLLALVTGLIVAISMPVTYFIFGILDQSHNAQATSGYLALRLRETIKEDPRLWKYNVQKFLKVLDEYQDRGITGITVYDLESNVVYNENRLKSTVLELKGRAPITYNNQQYGVVEVSADSARVLSFSLVLLAAFAGAGTLIGAVLFRYPVRIVQNSEEKVTQAFEQLNHLSYHDPLTDLPNRLQLNDRLQQAIKLAGRNKKRLAVLFLDLDRFKLINDTLGHSSGDSLLREVASRLMQCIRDGDTAARLGGDEFIILLSEIDEVHAVSSVAQRIIEVMNTPFVIDGHELVVTASIGVSVYPTDGTTIDSLVKNADTAMYHAKEHGKNVCRFYSPAMNTAALERLTLENGLRKALKQGELKLYYQPIIDLISGEIIGAEALVRWIHPEWGMVTPDRFIPMAEETGLIIPLGEWILRQACAQNKEWQDAGLAPKYVSVNLSARQFMQPGLAELIKRVLRETGLEPKYLQLEITERSALKNEQRVIAVLQNLRVQGINIAIDDFGTGFASLSSLKLPVNTVKIDKSFIHSISVDRFDASITRAVINMAQSVGLTVIAEGVEKEEQLAFLIGLGCNAMQGFLFCRPLPAAEIGRILSQRKNLLLGAR